MRFHQIFSRHSGWLTVSLLLSTITASAVQAPDVPAAMRIAEAREARVQAVAEYLREKGSPLAEHTEVLLQKKNWKLLIAISRIESQWCTRKVAYNCWGMISNKGYRHYSNYDEAINHASEVIEWWQAKGKWLTVESMNGSYVVPANPNWVRVVNSTLENLNILFID